MYNVGSLAIGYYSILICFFFSFVAMLLIQIDVYQVSLEEVAEGSFPLQKLNSKELMIYKTWRTSSILRALYYFSIFSALILWMINVSQTPEFGPNGGATGFWQRFIIGFLESVFYLLAIRVLFEVILVFFIDSKKN